MMVSALEKQGYRVWTVGDDIAWMQVGADGYLHAINPEAGFFGVAPGTNSKHQIPTSWRRCGRIRFLRHEYRSPAPHKTRTWWWGRYGGQRAHGVNRLAGTRMGLLQADLPPSRIPAIRCRQIRRLRFLRDGKTPAACRFPRSSLVDGARAFGPAVVYEATSWQHGVYVAATMASRKTTAAATGCAVGVTRRDPMAMLPFCGYNMADYFRHWFEMGRRIPHPPKIFHVNWFRKGADGKFLWPGFGENVRVLKWILERTEGKGAATETPIGFVPTADALTLDGLNVSRSTMEELLSVNPADWSKEHSDVGNFFQGFGERLPSELRDEHYALGERLQRVSVAQK